MADDENEDEVHSTQNWHTNSAAARPVFEQAGVRMRTGMWSLEEKRKVEKNVARFLARRPGLTVEEIVFSWTKKERSGFYKKAGKGIRRPLNSVYTYMLRRYHPYNYMGTYSKEEEERLLKLYDKYGPRWKKIGRKMKRAPDTVCVKHRAMMEKKKAVALHGSVKEGRWTDEEHDLLVAAVRELSESGDVDLPVVWDLACLRVPGKTATQCRHHWFNRLSLQSDQRKWSAAEDIKLVEGLYNSKNVQDGEIPWEEMKSEHLPDWQITAIKSAWCKLRVLVPGYTSLLLDDVLVWLYDHHLPKLRLKQT